MKDLSVAGLQLPRFKRLGHHKFWLNTEPQPQLGRSHETIPAVRLYSLYEILYPKRRIESYSILGTIVSANQILLKLE